MRHKAGIATSQPVSQSSVCDTAGCGRADDTGSVQLKREDLLKMKCIQLERQVNMLQAALLVKCCQSVLCVAQHPQLGSVSISPGTSTGHTCDIFTFTGCSQTQLSIRMTQAAVSAVCYFTLISESCLHQYSRHDLSCKSRSCCRAGLK